MKACLSKRLAHSWLAWSLLLCIILLSCLLQSCKEDNYLQTLPDFSLEQTSTGSLTVTRRGSVRSLAQGLDAQPKDTIPKQGVIASSLVAESLHALDLKFDDVQTGDSATFFVLQAGIMAENLSIIIRYVDDEEIFTGFLHYAQDDNFQYLVPLKTNRDLVSVSFISTRPWYFSPHYWAIQRMNRFRYGAAFGHLPLSKVGESSVTEYLRRLEFDNKIKALPIVQGSGDLYIQVPGFSSFEPRDSWVVGWVIDPSVTGDFLIEDGPRVLKCARSRVVRVPSDKSRAVALLLSERVPELEYWYEDKAEFPAPVFADFESMLGLAPANWRKKEWEVFKWSVFPEVLVIAFSNYATQSRYLGRLAFFVEKTGYRGTIPSEAQMRGKKDWNAHNYRPEGLLEFYEYAKANQVTLRPEEQELLDLSLRWGLLKQDSSGLQLGRGGLLSFAFDRASSPALRRLLLGHELLHGLYYMLAEMQAVTSQTFATLDDTSREFFLDYMQLKTYDKSDQYLMENEFQAYLLQQSASALSSAVVNNWIPFVTVRKPDTASLYNRKRLEIRDAFLQMRQQILDTIRIATGLEPPDLQELFF